MNNGQNQRAKLQKRTARKSRAGKMKLRGRASTSDRTAVPRIGMGNWGWEYNGKTNGKMRIPKVNRQRVSEQTKAKHKAKSKLQ